MYKSLVDGVDGSIRYARERYPLRVFLPVAGVLTAAAFANVENWGFDSLLSFVAVTTMVFQFRLWDDLADQIYDRTHHPGRVLSRAATLMPFVLDVVLVGIVNVGVLILLGRAYVGLVLLNLAAATWYFGVRIDWRRSIGGRHLLLLKYPAFVYLIAPLHTESRLVLSMTVVYLCSAIYELFHDGDTRSKPVAQAFMLMEACLLGFVVINS